MLCVPVWRAMLCVYLCDEPCCVCTCVTNHAVCTCVTSHAVCVPVWRAMLCTCVCRTPASHDAAESPTDGAVTEIFWKRRQTVPQVFWRLHVVWTGKTVWQCTPCLDRWDKNPVYMFVNTYRWVSILVYVVHAVKTIAHCTCKYIQVRQYLSVCYG